MGATERYIYLDHAATSHPKAPGVVAAMTSYLETVGANPGRSGHRPSATGARIIYDTRARLAGLLGVEDPRQVVFFPNATAALNQALLGWVRRGDHVVTTSMEHNSVNRPLRWLAEQREVRVSVVSGDSAGRLDPGAVAAVVDARTRLVVVNHGSNVVGTIAPIAELREAIGHVPLLVDGAQTVGSLPVDVARDGIDVLAFSGHKGLLGPQGTGGLYIRPGLDLEPLMTGGTGSRSESDEQPSFLPDRLESGTPNAVGLAGLGAALRFLEDTGVATIRARERALSERLWEGLSAIPSVLLYGPADPDERLATVSFRVAGHTPDEVGHLLDRRHGIGVRVGLHCAPAAHRTLGTFPEGTVRASAGFGTTRDDVDALVAGVAELAAEGEGA